ncbi:cytochrome P450 3A16-like [Physella acuta]|uniref:cytochrome P450 3A16-like n=1 Tax=Physella acuta TaxID=109671 RepID=UPI0027DDF858|nr:cytochrome P450 3A16-like [Physella acuta]XP_059171877.1 cytochrome P450 3A16-like [Physella acuta]
MSVELLDVFPEVTCTQIVLTAILLLLLSVYWYATSYHGVWERAGIPGPKPLPFLDHMLEFRRHGVEQTINKWFQTYGKNVGVYGLHPHRATLITKDLEIAKQVLVKDFDNFMTRYRPRTTQRSFANGLLAATDDRWRRHRHVTSPMFTGVKMKVMLQHIKASAETLTELIRQCVSKGELISVKLVASKFSTEVIARVGFGVQTHAVSKEENEFAHYARTLVNVATRKLNNTIDMINHFVPHVLPLMMKLLPQIDFINRDSDTYFEHIVSSTLNERKEEKTKTGSGNPRDMLDLLSETEVAKDDPRLHDPQSKALSRDEIIGNSTALILAGVETVSSALQGILYCLALNPDVQLKVLEEIDQVIPDGEDLEYEHLSQLKYTEQGINECLRLFPLLTSLMRVTAETRTYNGVTIPKGAIVTIPINLIMTDPEFWPEPKKFDPTRFTPENKAKRDPFSYMPFGYGPRICLGQRLAMMELKTIMVYLLKEFRFELSERTEPKKGVNIEMETIVGFVSRPVKPVEVEAVPR